MDWRALFENNPIMCFVVDAAGTVVSVNRSAAEPLAYTVDELIGRSVLDLCYQGDREAVQAHLAAGFEPLGHARSWELRKVRKDGTTIYIRETARAIRRTGREPVVLLVCEDITERKRTEDALDRAQAELAHVTRLTTLGQLAASIAHEVNQPLAAIVADANASLNWLTAAKPELERVRETLVAIATDGHRAADVIQRIRQLATKTEPRKVRLDVSEVVRDVVALVRAELARYQIALTLDSVPPVPSVVGDRVQLQQVVLNLVMNAIEAMASVIGRPRRLVIRSERHEDDGVRVAVHDTGVGIRASDLDQAFSAFFTTKPGGMGMGLSISRSIIEAHGGRLWAAPNEPHGAIVQFSLPVA
jgi:PAS domain S-box-containing protein